MCAMSYPWTREFGPLCRSLSLLHAQLVLEEVRRHHSVELGWLKAIQVTRRTNEIGHRGKFLQEGQP